MKRMMFVPIIVALLLAGCGTSISDARNGFCDNLGTLGQALEKAKSIDADSTVEEVKDVVKQLEEAMEKVRESSGILKDLLPEETDDAFSSMIETIRDIPDEATLREAGGTIQEAVRKFDAVYQVINTTICAGK